MAEASAWWVSAFLVCVACSGDDFTSGSGSGGQSSGGQSSGGGGGTGATGGAGTGGVSGSVSGGSGGEAGLPPPVGGAAGLPSTGGSAGAGPTACQYGGAGCPAGQYCKAVSCQAGICQQKQQDEDGSFQPVCGCDGITYWNQSVAAKHGESVKSTGECNLAGQHCPSGTCPGQARCQKSVLGQVACGGPDVISECWMLPSGCDGAETPLAIGCASGCKSVCNLIDMGEEYYGNSCN